MDYADHYTRDELLRVRFNDPCADNVRNQWNKSEDCEGKECSQSADDSRRVIHNESQLFKHHNVDESLRVGRVQLSDSF